MVECKKIDGGHDERPLKQKPSAKLPPLELLDSWLNMERTYIDDQPSYCHLYLRQSKDITAEQLDELYSYINHAHEGARQALRAPLGDTLHPVHHNTPDDPAYGYPHRLNDSALQGFFGEIMAGIVAEYYASDGEFDWKVPVCLFRTHIVAFQQLEQMKQTGNWQRQIFGRTGDDGLAFALDEDGKVSAWLACEAKCTCDHSSTLIADNHKKLNQRATKPIDLLRVIAAIKDYRDDDYRRLWVKALRDFYFVNAEDTTRNDLCMYVCGRSPKLRETWISTDAPHSGYKANRNLIAAECHLKQVGDTVQQLYSRMESAT